MPGPYLNSRTAPRVCPHCGEENIPPRALACPHCGADHNTGWKKDAHTYDGLDLPDDDFNYDEFVNKEFKGGAKPAGSKYLWWITGIILLIALLLYEYLAYYGRVNVWRLD